VERGLGAGPEIATRKHDRAQPSCTSATPLLLTTGLAYIQHATAKTAIMTCYRRVREALEKSRDADYMMRKHGAALADVHTPALDNARDLRAAMSSDWSAGCS
jgi:hypothetical protein